MSDYKVADAHFKLDRAKILQQQTVEVAGQPGVRRSTVVGDDEFLEYIYDDAKTVLDAFLRGIKESDNGPCYGYRPGKKEVPYEWLTYKEVWESAKNIGSGMLEKGLNSDNFIGIYSQNTVEWGIMDKGCCAYSLVSVPLYDTLGEEAVQFIINQCELSLVMVDCPSKAKRLIDYQKEGHIKSLKHIVIVDDLDQETISLAEEAGVAMVTWKNLETLGKDHLKETNPPKPDDLYTICYTSGTSGTPKGVMVTHKMIISDMAGAYSLHIRSYTTVDKNDVHISYLPFAHIFERIVHVMLHTFGSSIGYFRGDVKLLLNDVAALKPTMFNMVPRVMNKLHDRIMAQINQSFVKSKLFRFALNKKIASLKQGILRTDTIWDKLVFSKTQALVGGRVKICISGAAPVKSDIINFIRIVFGVHVTFAYGQTESSGGMTAVLFGDFGGTNVGCPVPCCHVKLIDVEDKEYYAKDGKGEVCARGPIVMKGYYKEPEKTQQVLSEDGWLRTGDVGEWCSDGSLKIIDRIKHIFKLSQGEYVAPDKIEQIYVMMAPIAQVFVYGDSLKSALVGIVVPDVECFANWCKSQGTKVTESIDEMCSNDEVVSLVLKSMAAFGKKHDLQAFEQVKAIKLINDPFSVENELLTPTLKSKRNKLEERFASDIEKMYKGLEQT